MYFIYYLCTVELVGFGILISFFTLFPCNLAEAPPVPKKIHNVALKSLDSVDAPLACTTPYHSSDTDIDPNKYLTNNNEVISLCEEEINLVVESMISLANEQEEKEKDKLLREQIDFIAEPECSKNNAIKEGKLIPIKNDKIPCKILYLVNLYFSFKDKQN